MMTLLSLLIAAPLGIFTAIYLVEYARRGNRLVGLVRITSEKPQCSAVTKKSIPKSP